MSNDTQHSEVVSDTRERPAAKDKTKELVNHALCTVILILLKTAPKFSYENFGAVLCIDYGVLICT
jgi:hypothetical protein